VDVTPELVGKHASLSRLAAAVLERGALTRAKSAWTVEALTHAYMKLQISRTVLEPSREAQMPCREGMPKRNKERMVIVLGSPRSGSTLLQLMLNMHPQLYAGQELYLLQYCSMEERAQRMASPELKSWAFEGLRKTIMELGPAPGEHCPLELADEILAQWMDLPTQDVYGILQHWAQSKHNCVLVDKTPPYCWSIDTLRRAETMWDDVQYIWIHRHPYASIQSMATEAVHKDFLKRSAGQMMPDASLDRLDDALWTECDDMWARGNANILEFFDELPAARRMQVAYEDLLQSPAATARSLCEFLRLPYEPAMVQPYTASNLATFEPASADGLGAGDPKLRQNKGINPKMADAWLTVDTHRGISQLARSMASYMGYSLPAWKEPALRSNAPKELIRLNSATGGVPLIVLHGLSGTPERARDLASHLPFPVFGIQMTNTQFEGDGSGFDSLASDYLRALDVLDLPAHVRLAGLDDTGARLAHAIIRMMADVVHKNDDERPPDVDALILLGGSLEQPFKPLHENRNNHQQWWAIQVEAALRYGYQCPGQNDFLAAVDECADTDAKLAMLSQWKPEHVDKVLEWDLHNWRVAQSVAFLSPRTVAYGIVEPGNMRGVPVICITPPDEAAADVAESRLFTKETSKSIAEQLLAHLKRLDDTIKEAPSSAGASPREEPAGPSPRAEGDAGDGVVSCAPRLRLWSRRR
jgi:LPS sulfotransferase NodH